VEQGVVEALAKSRDDHLRILIDPLHYTEVADLLEHLNPEERSGLIELIRFELDPAILSELDENVRDEIIDLLGVDEVAAAVSELESDDAVEIIEELDEERTETNSRSHSRRRKKPYRGRAVLSGR